MNRKNSTKEGRIMFQGKLQSLKGVIQQTKSEITNTVKTVQENKEKQKEQLALAEKMLRETNEAFINDLNETDYEALLQLCFDTYNIWGEDNKIGLQGVFKNRVTTAEGVSKQLEVAKRLRQYENEQQLVVVCTSTLKDYFEKIQEIPFIEEYWGKTGLISIPGASKCYGEFEDLLVTRNYEACLKSYGHFSSLETFIQTIGVENFYTLKALLFIAKELGFSQGKDDWRKYLKAIDKNAIIYTAEYVYNATKEKMGLEAGQMVLMLDQGKKKQAQDWIVWKDQKVLKMIQKNGEYICGKKDFAHISKEIDLDEVMYFKVEGEVYREQKISGGGSSDTIVGTVVGGLVGGTAGAAFGAILDSNDTKDIKSELVTHDTRKVLLRCKDQEKNLYFRFEDFEIFQALIPNKEYDIVEESRKRNLLDAEAPKSQIVVEETTISSQMDVIEQIKKLSELKEMGILSEEEFNAKKSELLSRI